MTTIRTDPTVPVDRQRLFVVRPGDRTHPMPGWRPTCFEVDGRIYHRWYGQTTGGTWCEGCDRLVIRLPRRSYFRKGRHRRG